MSKNRQTISMNINTTHWVPGTNKYRLNFLQPLDCRNNNATVPLYQYGIYNSSYNISSALNNNQFTINWLGTSYNCTIPDGYYSISDLNIVLQYNLTKNKLYCYNTTNSSQVVYNFALSVNASRYGVQLDINYIPASTATFWNNYSQPVTPGWTKPTVNTYPSITFSTNLEKLLGFDTTITTYPATTTVPTGETSKSFLSPTYPILSPVFTYILTCNLVHNKLSNIPNLFHQIPLDKGYGQLLCNTLPIGTGLSCNQTQHNYLEICLYDQDYKNLQMVDPELTLTVLITFDV